MRSLSFDKNGYVIIGEDYYINVRGLFVAGDVRDH